MFTIREGKTKRILESSVDSALQAVGSYNRPGNKFRLETYIVLMVIAWTKLFHAFFNASIGEKYFYKRKNGRYMIVNNERKAWELSECIKQYSKYQECRQQSGLAEPVKMNLKLFIELRNKIEHRYCDLSSLDIKLFGECQALLYNYEATLADWFGDDYALNSSLAYSLQFSLLREGGQLSAQKKLLSKEMKSVTDFIDKYRTNIPSEVYCSQQFSVKLVQIPKIGNTNKADCAIEFVKWNESDVDKYKKVLAIIRDKVVRIPVGNADMMKPGKVVETLKEKAGIEISISDHTLLWTAFNVRPHRNDAHKEKTDSRFCVYDEPHDDYLYTEEWVNFLVKLFVSYGFSKENLRIKCGQRLTVSDYV